MTNGESSVGVLKLVVYEVGWLVDSGLIGS